MTNPWTADAFATERVELCARRLGLTISHHQQWDFIRSTTSFDLQAAPGAGKTSLVGLKLCLIADAWTSTTQGLCVLSHTNTARDQIRDRISVLPAGRDLGRHPHFIGTIQSFVHTFFALPDLRARGVAVSAIDDDAYAAAAKRLVHKWKYATLRAALEHRNDGERILTESRFVFEHGALRVEPMPFSPSATSSAQLSHLKNALAWRGVFRYEDMFALAARYLSNNPSLIEAARIRFPFVLLDEMQDTSAMQQRLLATLFTSDRTVLQRVGDVNQRILGDAPGGKGSFPELDSRDLSVSRRFGPQIARVASALTVNRRQEIIGSGPDGFLVLIIFDDRTVTDVVPTFERLTTERIPLEIRTRFPPKVLGSRKAPGRSKKRPQSISCYVPGFAAPGRSEGAGGFITAAREAQVIWNAGGDAAKAVDYLWGAARALLRHVDSRNEHGDRLRPPVLAHLERAPGEQGWRLRALFVSLLEADLGDKDTWVQLTERLQALLEEITDRRWTPATYPTELLEFVVPAEHLDQTAPQKAGPNTPGLYAGTIQNSKGETHSATLILECLDATGKNYVLQGVLPTLVNGEPMAETSLTARERDIAQLVFVGATRPTHLLAMAILRDHALPYLEALGEQGWEIHDITADDVHVFDEGDGRSQTDERH
ncbi:UvrD-helicase domain-containing protein [Embleya sp. NPDC059237]|uniref:UvrD-helicase domain-containing protein n=1 Tax=Embleya sp. NPDC059237 TaxID=3346784 RepID=UPI0036AC28A8